MNPRLERALVLFQQGRSDLAEPELRQGLSEDPGDAGAHALLALCLTGREAFEEAEAEAREAVRRGPDLPFAFFALGSVLQDRHRTEEAEAAAAEAVRLDPLDPDFHALRASLRHELRDWAGSLAAAEEGLRADPRHPGCANLRALALIQLGRRTEAAQGLEFLLSRDPESALTHANRGWGLLHESRPKEALEHFREALRLDPELEHARAGVVEALKARNPVYGLMLRYFLWMGRLSRRAQWGVLLGGMFGSRALRALAEERPGWAPWIWPLLIAYAVFALGTWIAYPLFNLLLRLNRFGRLALTEEQVTASNWIGGALAAALAALGVWAGTGDGRFLLAALGLGILLIPLAGTFSCDPGWPRRVMAATTALLFLCGLGTLALLTAGSRAWETLGGVFLAGAVLSSWAGNLLAMARPRR